MDYIKVKERVFPIGRLDFNTSGLLLLTNDGDFANKIMHPRYEITKTYRVEIDRAISKEEISMIEKGINLGDFKTSPAKVRKREGTLLEITIHEGKNRIIRRILKKMGFRVLSLERIRIGNLKLSLAPGRYKEMSKKDKELVFE